MRSTQLLPVAMLAFGVACAENASDLTKNDDGPALSSVHLKGGPRAEPTFTDNGLTLTVSGQLSGLSGADIFVALSGTASGSGTCTNPGSGAVQPAGHNPAPVPVSGGQAIPAEEFKNGNVTFGVTTEEPESPVPGAPGCPNPQWIQAITDLSFLSATITVHQPSSGGATSANTVLTISCSLTTAGGAGTANGGISAGQVTCTQT